MPSSAGRTQLPGLEHDSAGLQVLARKAAILAGLAERAGIDVNACRILARALLHHDAVGAFRHHAAGEDAHALARRRRVPAQGLPANDSPTRIERRLALRIEVGEAHRIPVHRGIVVPRHGERRDHGHGQHARRAPARMCTRSVAVTGERNVRISARAVATGIESGS